MNKLTLPALRKLINETINEIDLEDRRDEGHHDSKDEVDMKDVDEADVNVGVPKEEGEKHLEESVELNRWRKLAGILKG